MIYWVFSSIQQYTINKLRVSFSKEYEVEEINKLSFKIFDSSNSDVTNIFKTISESNNWEYTIGSSTFDIELKENSFLNEGTYTIKIFYPNKEEIVTVYNKVFSINYMEDIRIEFDEVHLDTLDTLHITFKSKYDDLFQTKKMLSLMNFSIIGEDNITYSDVFEPFSGIVNASLKKTIKEVHLKLKDGKVLPAGLYTIRLTSIYKNRAFSIVQKDDVIIPFMTTTPPSIGNAYITKRAANEKHPKGEVTLSIVFDNYLEKTMMDLSTRKIYLKKGLKKIDVTNRFDSDKVATTSLATAGVMYSTKLDIPLITDFYTLEKGTYEIEYTWNLDYFKKITSNFTTDWCLHDVTSITLNELKMLSITFPDLITKENMEKFKYKLEVNGNTIPAINYEAFGKIVIGEPVEGSNNHYNQIFIPIENKEKLLDGLYSFILYTGNDDDEVYDYIANINIREEISPIIKSVSSSIDVITVTLKNPIPIEVLEYCTATLLDNYGNIDFSDRLLSIRDSNEWAPGQTSANIFNILINATDNLRSGEYTFFLNIGDIALNKVKLTLQYMEARKGFISGIEQLSLSEIKISFSETQSRQFLLSTKLSVRKKDGHGDVDVTERFELLENVLKAGVYSFDDVTIPLDKEDSIDAGRYTISFIYTKNATSEVIYSYDVELSYMTNKIPVISRVLSEINKDNLMELTITFANYVEQNLFNKCILKIISSQNIDIYPNFKISKTITSETKGIIYIREFKLTLLDKTRTIERDTYDITMSWPDVKFMPVITKDFLLDYYLPYTIENEVASLAKDNTSARLYFKFDKILQYAYFEDLKVQVFNKYYDDHTDCFDTIQQANDFGPDAPDEKKISTDNINLDILDLNDIDYGVYTFVFYHEKDGIRTSEYISMLDIRASISPTISTMYTSFKTSSLSASGDPTLACLHVILSKAMPVSILKQLNFEFVSFKKVDYTDYFKTIKSSNTEWDKNPDIREVSEFDIVLNNGYAIGEGNYSLFLKIGDHIRLEQCDIHIDYIESSSITVDSISSVDMETIRIDFNNEQARDLLSTLTISIYDENNNDISKKFSELASAVVGIKTDYFTSLDLSLKEGQSIPYGNGYSMEITKNTPQGIITLWKSPTPITLHYMSTTYPILYEVTSTKMAGSNADGIQLCFDPPLEKTQFEAIINKVSGEGDTSGISIKTSSGVDIFNKFESDSRKYQVEYEEYNDISYIENLRIPFVNGKVLNKEKYIVTLHWAGEYSYMKDLSREANLNYILLPVKSLKLKSLDTLEMTFLKSVSKEKLKNTSLIVTSAYQTKNKDGVVTIDIDFTKYFESITESNDFDNLPDQLDSIIIKMNSKEFKDAVIPSGRYRVIIKEKYDESVTSLQYAYSDAIRIDFMVSSNDLETPITVEAISYDTLKITFENPQLVDFIENSSFKIYRKDDNDKEYSCENMFLSIKESNYYEERDPKTYSIIKSGYYIDASDTDMIVDDIHYTIRRTPYILIKLQSKCAIPKAQYTIYFNYQNVNYFENEIYLRFMCSKPPKVNGIRITDDKRLSITFEPKAEIGTLLESDFGIQTRLGLKTDKLGNICWEVIWYNENGDVITNINDSEIITSIYALDKESAMQAIRDQYLEYGLPASDFSVKEIYRGNNMRDNFGDIVSGDIITSDNVEKTQSVIGITYVDEIILPISASAKIPSGKYHINWNWAKTSLLPASEYDGSLSAIAREIKSVMTYDSDTIQIIFDEKYKASYIKSLDLTVYNSEGLDCTDLFDQMDDSNETIADDDETDTFYITTAKDEEVTQETYTFSLSFDSEGEDPEEDMTTEVFNFDMSLVYLSDSLPLVVNKIDNLSGMKYDIVELTNTNISNYIGCIIKGLDKDDSTILELTDDNSEVYLNTLVKVYHSPTFDTLTADFDDEVPTCLLLATQIDIIDAEGVSHSNKFKDPSDCNSYEHKEILNFIEFTLPKNTLVDEIEEYEISITCPSFIDEEDNPEGEIGQFFEDISESNEFDSDYSKKFKLYIDEEMLISKSDLRGMSIGIKSDTSPFIKFTYNIITKLISTANYIDFSLKPGMVFEGGDNFQIMGTYQNEPTLQNAKKIVTFVNQTDLPMLSTKLGHIYITTENVYTLKVTFSEDFLISTIKDLEFEVLNEDMRDVSDIFMSIEESNKFDENATYISELEDPYSVLLKINVGSHLSAGNYVFKFKQDTIAGEPDEENKFVSYYTLWEFSISLSYMVNDLENAIQDIQIYGIDKLKVTLKNPVDIDLLKNFAIDATNVSNDNYFGTETFKDLLDSNDFGKSVLLTSNRYIIYSNDGVSWIRFNTGQEVKLTDIYYDISIKTYFVTCANGTILSFKTFEKDNIKVHKSPAYHMLVNGKRVDFSLNRIIPLGYQEYLVIGAGGLVFKARYVLQDLQFTTIEIPSTQTLNDVIINGNTIVIVGVASTILVSLDKGATWNKCLIEGMTSLTNITDVVYYSGYVENADPEDPDSTDTVSNSGYYIIGSAGLVAYCENANGLYKKISTPITNNLYSITTNGTTLVAVGDAGKIIYSDNGEDWQLANSGISFSLNDIEYCDTRFIACSLSGKWITSSAGYNWTTASSTYNHTFTKVKNIDSQYEDNRKCSSFYVKISDGYKIGANTYYEGTEIPDLTNNPAKYWVNDNIKANHVGDIYTVFKTDPITGDRIIDSVYQFKVEDYANETTGELEYRKFYWSDCTSISPIERFSGDYIFDIVITGKTLSVWTSSEPTGITYLTSSPGEITGAEILSPDDIVDIDYAQPFLRINMDKGDEHALRYSSFSVYRIDTNGNILEDVTDAFCSIQTAKLGYASSTGVSNLDILTSSKLSKLTKGTYLLEWKWSGYIREDSDIIKIKFEIGNIINIINKINVHTPSNSEIQIDLNSFTMNGVNMLPKEYFYKDQDGRNTAKINIRLYRYPTSAYNNPTYNNFNIFKSIENSTNFNDPNIFDKTLNYVKRIILKVDDNERLEAGEYLLKISNEDYDLSRAKDMVFFSSKIIVSQEVTDIVPTISSVKVEKYTDVVEPEIEGAKTTQYYGTCSVFQDTDIYTLEQNWIGSETQSYHVGDMYENTNTKETWSYRHNKIADNYGWVKDEGIGYLMITFDERPTLLDITNNISKLTLIENDGIVKDYSSYINMDILQWDYDITKINGTAYVSKLKIPLDYTRSFYGTKNGTFILSWTDDCNYKEIIVENLKLSPSIFEYGEITNVTIVSIENLETSSIDKTVLLVQFSRPQLVSFLKGCVFELTRKVLNSSLTRMDEEDLTRSFKSITASNADAFESEIIVNSIYLELLDGQILSNGSYSLTIEGPRPKDDVIADDSTLDANIIMKYYRTIDIPWLTNSVPKLISVKFEKKKTGYTYPVLTVTFKDAAPPLAAIQNGKIKVTLDSTTGSKDYSSNFVTLFKSDGTPNKCIKINYLESSIIEKETMKDLPEEGKSGKVYYVRDINKTFRWSEGETYELIDALYMIGQQLVNSIEIPMKRCVGLAPGVYDVHYIFNEKSKLSPVPIEGTHAQFTISEKVITKFAKVVKIRGNQNKRNKLTVWVKFDASMNSDRLVAKSTIGKILKVKTRTALMKKLSLFVTRAGEAQASMLGSKPKISGKGTKLEYTMKNNSKINPGTIRVGYSYNEVSAVGSILEEKFEGLIKIKMKGAKDLRACWIVEEVHNGVKTLRVYSKYKFAKARIDKLKKLNEKTALQYKKCKKCKTYKLLSTSKVKAHITKYLFKDGKIDKFMKKIINVYYKKFVTKNLLVDGKIKKCSKAKFSTDHKDNNYNSHKCKNMVSTSTPYKWYFRIANMSTSYPKNKKVAKRKIYFEWIKIKDVELPRGFKATASGKKSSKLKKYGKKLNKWIKNYKKSVSKCNKCKKRTIALKGTKKIGWSAALFDINLMKFKNDIKSIEKLVTKAYKTKDTSSKKKRKKNKKEETFKPCKNAKFVFVKSSTKKCKLSCKNRKSTDKSLSYGSKIATFVK